MIVSQEKSQENGNSYEDTGLFSTCTSYSESSDGDAKLSDSQLKVSLTTHFPKRDFVIDPEMAMDYYQKSK